MKSKSPEEASGLAGLGDGQQEELSGERSAQERVEDDQKWIVREKDS